MSKTNVTVCNYDTGSDNLFFWHLCMAPDAPEKTLKIKMDWQWQTNNKLKESETAKTFMAQSYSMFSRNH